jgi:hypothetical protein
MPPSESSVVNPYATTPGSSTPGRGVSREEGVHDLWAFFWLAIASTAILVGVGLGTFLVIHH